MAEQTSDREEIAVIGGGRGGVETALMLAKQYIRDRRTGESRPKYHVTLIEAQDHLLNGASLIASRLHLGGEYPLDPQTAADCVKGAVIFKLLMPDNIYTPAPPMKFLVAEATEAEGKADPANPKALTLDKYQKSYVAISDLYEKALQRLKGVLKVNFEKTVNKWDAARLAEKQAQDRLFGPADELFHRFSEDEKHLYAAYNQGKTAIAGGFQSKEPGINVGKYLAMLQQEVEKQEALGNITLLKGCRIKKDGIEGKLGNFHLLDKNGNTLLNEDGTPRRFDQVILAAWRDNPAIENHLKQEESPKSLTVFKRAMMLVDLPRTWKTPPAFIMLGASGGMLSPYNDKTAICYLPTLEAAYRKNITLDDKNSSLPENWDDITPKEKEEWTERYFALLKKRFPELKSTKNPRLIIRDTISFQTDIDQRPFETVAEVGSRTHAKFTQVQAIKTEQVQNMEMVEIERHHAPKEVEARPGLFTLYPTKGTYSLRAAIQATAMINDRSLSPEKKSLIARDDALGLVLDNMEQYSLANMEEPSVRFLHRFCREHPDIFGTPPNLNLNILKETWPGQAGPSAGRA